MAPVNCPDCEAPDKEWWEKLETSERYLRKTCSVCKKSEVVEDEVRFCDCGGEYAGWSPKV